MKQIKTLEQLMRASEKGKGVYVQTWKRKTSASFVTGLPARVVYNMLTSGNIYAL